MVPNLLGNFKINSKYGAMAATATPFLVFGSVYIAWAYLSQAWRRKKEKPPRVLKRSMSLGALLGGKLALERLITYHEARANNETLEIAECQLRVLFEGKEALNFWDLQTIVSKLEMSGKEEHAVNILEKALRKANVEGRVQEAYEIEMSLVEMLIYKGDFSKAFEYNCLKDEHNEIISDARRPLYKAIIKIMENDNEEDKVREFWEKFSDIREHFHCPPSFRENMLESGMQIHDLSTNFEEFKKVVQTLKEDIKKAKEKKAKEKKVKK